MNITRISTIAITSFAMLIAFGLLVGSPSAAQAQGFNSLRNPLIPGALTTDPYQAPPPSLPPPPGQGFNPAPVTPGMGGGPTVEPWVPYIPANQIDQQDSQVNLPDPSILAPPGTLGKSLSVPHAPSTPGADPGMIHAPQDFSQPPVANVNINPQGGFPGDQAPQQRWGGQTTRDFGLRHDTGSTLTDFGQKLQDKPDLKMNPQTSQDGPRQANYPGLIGCVTNRQSSIPGAQTTLDWYGNRRMFKGPQERSKATIAPY